jgi:hypothetical protein
MSAHRYRVTLEYLGGKHAGPELHKPLMFEAGNHDDLFGIIANVQKSGLFEDADTAAALTLGMKLFGEVVLANRKDPLFQKMFEDFGQYMGAFKLRVKEALEQQAQQDATKAPPPEPEID